MKNRTGQAFLVLLCVLLLTACSKQEQSNAVSSGFHFAVLDGVPLRQEELGDRLLLINYWAVWCKPCLEEMPELATFRNSHLDQVELVGVNYDRPAEEKLREEVARLQVEIPVLLDDPQETLGFPRAEVLPVTWVIRHGEAVEQLVGPQTQASLQKVLDKWGGSK